jgi:hypothetical protein
MCQGDQPSWPTSRTRTQWIVPASSDRFPAQRPVKLPWAPSTDKLKLLPSDGWEVDQQASPDYAFDDPYAHGQYLALIYYYTKIHGVPPAEADMQRYFNVSPPPVHNMVVMLEKRGFIRRTPGAARSIRLLLSRAELPDLE